MGLARARAVIEKQRNHAHLPDRNSNKLQHICIEFPSNHNRTTLRPIHPNHSISRRTLLSILLPKNQTKNRSTASTRKNHSPYKDLIIKAKQPSKTTPETTIINVQTITLLDSEYRTPDSLHTQTPTKPFKQNQQTHNNGEPTT
jgi:hypothetical protein